MISVFLTSLFIALPNMDTSPIFGAIVNDNSSSIAIEIKNRKISMDDFTDNKNFLLYKVIEKDSINIFKLLVKQGLNLDIKNPTGKNLISIASTACSIKIFNYLNSEGSDLLEKDKYGKSSIYHAATSGCTEIFQTIKSIGIEDNYEVVYTDDAVLSYFVSIGFVEASAAVVKLTLTELVEHWPSIQLYFKAQTENDVANQLIEAILANDISSIKDGLAIYPSNQPIEVIPFTRFGFLEVAISSNNLEVFEFLVGIGFDVHYVNPRGQNLISISAMECNRKSYELLKGLGVSLDIKDQFNKTAIYYAAINNCQDIFYDLSKSGVKNNYLIKDGNNQISLQELMLRLFG